MYRGQVVESGPARQILTDPQHPYTQRLVASAPSLSSRRIQVAHAQGVQTDDLLAQHAAVPEPRGMDEIVAASHLTKVFRLRGHGPGTSDFTAVDDVSFSLARGRTLALVGESGSGKSTAANMVLGLLEPTSGTVRFDGQDIAGLGKRQQLAFRRRIQPVFQNPYGSLDPQFSIHRTLEEPLRAHRIGDRRAREARVRELLDMGALPQTAVRRFPNELSGGSASASPSHARSRCSRTSSSSTRPCPPSTCWCRLRSSSSSRSCSVNWVWRTCSSPTTWPWCGRSPTQSS